MNRISKSFAVFIILILIISSLTVIITTIPFGRAQSGTTVSSTNTKENTPWTKANSPYLLTGPVLVNNEVTLTIEPGVRVELNTYILQVNGTLVARRNSAEKISFEAMGAYTPDFDPLSPGGIEFTKFSTSWNEKTGTGSIIEDATLNSTTISIQSASPKIDNDNLNDSSININTKVSFMGTGSPVIYKNVLINSGIVLGGFGVPIIASNNIQGGNNGIYMNGGNASISNNRISGCKCGISLNTIPVFMGEFPSYPIVERNLIANNTQGITISLYNRFDSLSPGMNIPVIKNNTVSENSIGFYVKETNYISPTFLNNNVENNTKYNIYLAEGSTRSDVNATYNWWGTTDSQAISQKIHDNTNDFNLGKVSYAPFLTEQNSQAMPNPNAPIPKPSSSTIPSSSPVSTPSPSPTVPEVPPLAILPLFAVIPLIATIVLRKKHI